MPESTQDLTLLVDAAREAGQIALRYFEKDPQVWEKSGGAGPVTQADLEVDAMLRSALMAARPGTGWLSEETEDDADRLGREDVFIVDPIDGTRAFIEGAKHWAHSLALTHKGQVTAAVVYLPATGDLFAASAGQGATLNGDPLSISTRSDVAEAKVLSNKLSLRADHWDHGVPPVDRHFRSSLAYRLALVSQGRFDAMLTLRPTWEWDIAAGTLLVQEAGGAALAANGAAAHFNTPQARLPGLLAGPATMLESLLRFGPRLPVPPTTA